MQHPAAQRDKRSVLRLRSPPVPVHRPGARLRRQTLVPVRAPFAFPFKMLQCPACRRITATQPRACIYEVLRSTMPGMYSCGCYLPGPTRTAWPACCRHGERRPRPSPPPPTSRSPSPTPPTSPAPWLTHMCNTNSGMYPTPCIVCCTLRTIDLTKNNNYCCLSHRAPRRAPGRALQATRRGTARGGGVAPPPREGGP